MRKGKIKKPWRDMGFFERRRLSLLESLAYAAEPPIIGVVGQSYAQELIAVAKGARRPDPRREGKGYDAVLCFHWEEDEPSAIQVLRDYSNSMAGRTRRAKGPVPLHWVIKFVCNERGRKGWHREVMRLATEEGARFGMVVHLGTGDVTDLQGDIDTLVPMMTDQTIVVLVDTHKVATRKLLERMVCRQGWDAIEVADLAICKRGAFPRET